MISVATYPVGEMVGNKPNLISLLTSTASATPPWWKEWITPIACLVLLGLFWNYVSNDLAELNKFKSTAEVDLATLQANTKAIENVPSSISRIEDKLKTLSDPSASLARLEEKLKALERSVYKTKAEAAGFKNPYIVPVSLEANQTFETTTPTPKGEYFTRFTILSYHPNQRVLQVRVDGRVRGAVLINNIITISHVMPGTFIEIPRFAPGLPRVFVQILELPSPTQAIVAIGLNPTLASKPSHG